MSQQTQKFSVAVIGRGITGVSAAYYLHRMGIQDVALIGPDRTLVNCGSAGTRFVTAGTIDNITRINHQYGLSMARSLLDLGGVGYSQLRDFSQSHQLTWHEGEIQRLATSQHESQEMVKATKILVSLGRNATLGQFQQSRVMGSPSLYAIQKDGLGAAVIHADELLEKMELQSKAKVITQHISSLESRGNSVRIVTAGHSQIDCELLVLANHLNAAKLLPDLKDALVSYADQEVIFTAQETEALLPAGNVYIAHHGHYTFWKDDTGYFHMSGGRFLRPLAGLEAREPSVFGNITEHLTTQASKWFNLSNTRVTSTRSYLECRPCDEVPLIGPMFGNESILLGTGYSGSGLALGHGAGKALAELVTRGQSDILDAAFHPKRLRSF